MKLELIMNMALELIETWKYSWSRTFFGLWRHNINHVHVRVKKDHAPITQLRDFLNAAAFSSLTVSLILPLVHSFSGHVLTMRPDSELQRRVVLGVDDSEHSERAFDCKYVNIIKSIPLLKKAFKKFLYFLGSDVHRTFARWNNLLLLHAIRREIN